MSYERSPRWVCSTTKGIGMYGMQISPGSPTGVGLHLFLEERCQARPLLGFERGALPDLLGDLGQRAIETGVILGVRLEEPRHPGGVAIVAERAHRPWNPGREVLRQPRIDGVEVPLQESPERLARAQV